MTAHRWVFVAYAGVAMVEQFLIWRDIAGRWRPILGGILDMALLTFIVQRIGSSRTMIVALYFVAGIVNSLVVTPRLGVLLSSIGAAMYSSVVIMEVRGVLPFAPDGPEWLQSRAPTAAEGFLQAFLVTILLMFGTAIVATLIQKINQRENQLVVANERLAELLPPGSADQALEQATHLEPHRTGSRVVESWTSHGDRDDRPGPVQARQRQSWPPRR